MKNIIVLLSLFYCNTFDLKGSNENERSFFASLNLFNFISHTTAQSLNKEHQQTICQKLKNADYNGDKKIDSADYSLIYLVSMKDQITLENVGKNPDLLYLMDLSLEAIDRAPANANSENKNKISDVNEQDVAVFYNYLTNNIPYCPYKNYL